ncbi:MAG: hypothetical protein QMC85_00705 [Methanocellales archaeon]|nr:hypothetical protein [Methanocellales archaeon]MDI6903727.1 hypothetical protein [Methanocellales archaeon]
MTTVSKTTRLTEELIKGVKYRSQREKVDESTAIRQLLSLGLREYAVLLYKNGESTLREAADICGITPREMLEVLIEHGVRGNVKFDQQRKSLEYVRVMSGIRG